MEQKPKSVRVTIEGVDSIPCSLVGQSVIVDSEGTCITKFVTPWKMEWVTEEISKAVLTLGVDISARTDIYNPMEPDQYAKIHIERYDGDMMGNKDGLLGGLVDKWSAIHPDKTVIISENGKVRLTYAQLRDESNKLAKALIKIGVKKADRIGLWLKNCPEWVVIQIAAAKIGAVLVPMNAHEKRTQTEYILKNCELNMLIMSPGVYADENLVILGEILPDCKLSPDLPFLGTVICMGGIDTGDIIPWETFIQSGSDISEEELTQRFLANDQDDVIHIIQTSGTTGLPKGVMLTHINMIGTAERLNKRMNITDKDIFCVTSPLYHTFGCVASVTGALVDGCSMMLMHNAKAATVLARLSEEKCTVAMGVPRLYFDLTAEAQNKKYDLGLLRTGIVAGAYCPEKLMRSIHEHLGMTEIINAYGLTETSPGITSTNYADTLEKKLVGIGAPLEGIDVKVFDLETGKEAEYGKQGEICCKGDNIMKGYYNKPEETKQTIDENGWLHTGDIGWWDVEVGYLRIGSRMKDIIIRGGENISPQEVEDYILTNPKVSDIHVVGVPDEMNGEELAGFIKLVDGETMTEQELRDYCLNKIARNKIPKYIEFVTEFPQSNMGKVLKRELREIAKKKYATT